jgi:hypothetical protein
MAGYLQDPGQGTNGMGGYDPIYLQSMMQSMPQIQAAALRAKQLQGAQAAFQALSQNQGQGNYTPAQSGVAKWTPVQQWHPDYSRLGNAVTGALGQAATMPQANAAQSTLDQLRSQAFIRGIQQVSSGVGGSGGVMGGGGYGSGNLYQGPTSWPGQGTGWAGMNPGQ